MQKHVAKALDPTPPVMREPAPPLRPDFAGNRKALASRLRWPLLIAGPLVVLAVAAYFYVTGGRYVGTDNAYVKADKVTISAEVAGPIRDIKVRENARLAEGDVLFRIDEAPYRVALDRAEAQLAATLQQIATLKATYRQKLDELKLAETTATFAQRDLDRQVPLASKNYTSQARLDQARFTVDSARQKIEIARGELEQIKAQLAGNPDAAADTLPQYLQAKAARDNARIDLDRTTVRAPFVGVASKVPMLGQYVAAGTPVMAIVADTRIWIEANYKETELTGVRPGQPVEIRVDTYPGQLWHGVVDSIAQATGAEFSVLPPQNATGNWVKIVQRIPVRIAVENDPSRPPLRVGMSTQVDIDTKARGAAAPPTATSGTPTARAPGAVTK